MAASHLASSATTFLACARANFHLRGIAGVLHAGTNALSVSTPGSVGRRLRVDAKSRKESRQVQALPKFAEYPQLSDTVDNGSLRESSQVSFSNTPVEDTNDYFESAVQSGNNTGSDNLPKDTVITAGTEKDSTVDDVNALLEENGGSKKQKKKKKDGKQLKTGKKGKGHTKLAIAVEDDAIESVSKHTSQASEGTEESESSEVSEVLSEKKEKKVGKKEKEKKEKKGKKGKDGKEKKGKGKKRDESVEQIVEASVASSEAETIPIAV